MIKLIVFSPHFCVYMLSYYNFFYILFIGAGFPLLRYMSQHFDPNNNNMVRFFAGSVVLLLYGIYRYREQFVLIFQDKSLFWRVILLAILMSTNMYLFMLGLANTNAVTGSIFSVLAMPLALLMAALFYADERQRVIQPQFYIGTIIAVIGSFLFISFRHKITTDNGSDFILGTICLIFAIVIQAVQSLIIKSVKGRLHSVIISFYTALLAGIINLIICIHTHKLVQLASVSEGLLIALALAGIYGIVTGMMMSFHIVQTQGIVIYNMLQLLVPVAAAFCAYIFLHEKMTLGQIFSAFPIIAGCLWALKQDDENKPS